MASIIKVDQLSEKTQGSGITLSHSLKNSSGSEIISPAGTVSNLSKLSLTPSSAPSSPVQGDMYLDSSDSKLKIYTGTQWVTVVNASPNFSVEYLVVAGGGAGGDGTAGGGGGAGGYRSSVTSEQSGMESVIESAYLVSKENSYTITVGSGATASVGTSYVAGQNGFPSTFAIITSLGGGGGAGEGDSTYGHNGKNGGSGGGSCFSGSAATNGTTGQGYGGGLGSTGSNFWGGGGGGGAGSVGITSIPNNGGNGGVGLQSSITGIATYYSGGGGGAIQHLSGGGLAGSGGIGGGGAGARDLSSNGAGSVNGVDGTVNTGGGGGGGPNNTSARPGNGGKGIVIISYSDTYPDLVSIDVSHTCRGATTVSGTTTPPAPNTSRAGYKTYEFLDGDGNISW